MSFYLSEWTNRLGGPFSRSGKAIAGESAGHLSSLNKHKPGIYIVFWCAFPGPIKARQNKQIAGLVHIR
jgi:hypothetical protein